MHRTISRFQRFLLILPFLFLIGCNSTPSILGTWKADFRGAALQLTFGPTGKLSGTGTFNDLSLDLSGTYQFDGHDLTFQILDAHPSGAEMNPMLVAVVAQAKGFTESGHLEWKNGNEFILTTKRGVPIPFDRQGAK